MPEYKGSKCLSCGNVFNDSDDIVVCPDCGTPYHRECYKKEGKCINTELHENGKTWTPDSKKESFNHQIEHSGVSEDDNFENNEPKVIRCEICGSDNPSDFEVCQNCGASLKQQSGKFIIRQFQSGEIPPEAMGTPFSPFSSKVTQDDEIDGVTVKELATYVGKNEFYYIANFLRLKQTGNKKSLCFSAFFFPHIYFFYRKLYLPAILYFLLNVFVSVFNLVDALPVLMESGGMLVEIFEPISKLQISSTLLSIVSIVDIALRFISGLYGIYLYKNKATSDIKKIKERYSDDQALSVIKQKGGVSMSSVILSLLAGSAVLMAVSTIIGKLI